MNHNDFFEEVSMLADHCDREMARNIYYAMIKVISRKLRSDRKALMPDWGEFYLHNHPPRKALNINNGTFVNLGMRKTLKFNPDYKVREYFKML